MSRRKSGFWTFICSLIPGAGEMYLGFLREGVSIMTLCAVLLACDSWIGLYPAAYGLPILWFYSFFDTHNKAGLPEKSFTRWKTDICSTWIRYLLPNGWKDADGTLLHGP